jgi:hypothetical protein
LGTAPSATPARLIEPTMGDSGNDSKPELSTLLGTGTFYFALTGLRAFGWRRRPHPRPGLGRCVETCMLWQILHFSDPAPSENRVRNSSASESAQQKMTLA